MTLMYINQQNCGVGNQRSLLSHPNHYLMKYILKPLLIALAFVLAASTSQAQYRKLLKHFGHDYQSFPSAKMVIPTDDGPIAVGSIEESSGSGYYDIYLTQFDNSGNVLWATRYGTAETTEVAKAAIKGSANNVIIVGQRNYQEASITSIDISTGNVSWNRNIGVGTPSVIENLTTVAEIGATGEYMAMGTVFQAGKLELLSVKFNNTGTIFWSKLLPEFVLDPHPFDLTATNLIDLPLEDRMALTGTASISGSNERVYAAYVDKATGVITEFKVYEVDLFGNNMHSIAGDICLQATNKLALVFTTFNDTKTNSRIMYLQLKHNTTPSNELTPSLISGYNISYGLVSLAYNHGLNVYKDLSGLDIGMKFGTSFSNSMPGVLEITNSGSIVSVTAHTNYDNYQGIALTKNGASGYYMKSKLGSDGYVMTQTDLSGLTIFGCYRPALAVEISDYDVNTQVFGLLSSAHGAFDSDDLNRIEVSGFITNCDGFWTGFKKNTTSIENQSTEDRIYPTSMSSEDILHIESGKFNGDDLIISITGALGQQLYLTQVHPNFGESITLPSRHFVEGVNFILVRNTNGKELLNSRVIKR